MGKPDSPDLPIDTPPLERPGKVSGVNLRPEFLQIQELQRQILGDVVHHINNPLSVLTAELDYLESEGFDPHNHLKTFQALLESAKARIKSIMEIAKPESRQPVVFKEMARQLELVEVDVVSLQTSFRLYFVHLDLDDIQIFDACENMSAGILKLRQRLQEAITRLESPDPREDFFCVRIDGSTATYVALQRAGWKDSVQLVSNENIHISTAIEPLSVVFENLIINAAKYGGKLQIFTDVEGGSFVIRFEDDGPGFTADPSKMFGTFVQGEQNSKSGFGFGMSICKRIVHKMNGEIWAENMFNEKGDVCGARVSLRFPLLDEY